MRILACIALVCLACPAAQARTTIYAVAIGNNAPPLRDGGGLAPLRYADDDAVRYHQFFSRFADEAFLLSVLDDETRQRYPQELAVARPPTLRALRETVRELAARMKADLERGDRPILFLAYSGHGAQSPDGAAYLALADGELTKKILYEEILDALPADFVHLFVDACHAEAVVGARGLFAREADAVSTGLSAADASRLIEAESLRRFPHVGALLATTTDQQSHEWSRIEAGVFTHELLSGLAGAADVNGDGVVEYSEIQAFIAAANADIHDPRALPRVVAYPPAVNPRAPLVSMAWLHGVAFLEGDLSGLEHFHVELQDGQRYLDAHLSSERPARLALPAGQVAFVVAAGREAQLQVRAGQTVSARSLGFRDRDSAARGSIEATLRAALFQSPFGPTYYKGFVDSIGVPRVSFALELKGEAATLSPRKPMAVAAFTLAGLSFAAMATTTGLALKAQSDYNSTNLQRSAAEAQDRYVRCRTAAIVTGVGAVAAGLAGILLWPAGGSTTAFSPTLQPGGVGVSVAGVW